jgi:thiol-disulfide isomerase/thioredoxin
MKLFTTLMCFFACTASLCLAAELGDPAAPLTIQEWIKGEPIAIGPGMSNVVVVEFWATWCPPCLISIPHLTELQKQFADQGVRFVGISSEPPDTVRPFVDDMGDKMGYTVAVDLSNATSEAYMEAYGERGIPHAFIIDTNGVVIWHAHPMSDFESVIPQILAGTFDPVAVERKEALTRAVGAYGYLISEAQDSEASSALALFLLSQFNDDAEMLLSLPSTVMAQSAKASQVDFEFACLAATRAAELTGHTNAAALHALGRAQWLHSNTAEAIGTLAQAAALPAESAVTTAITNDLARMRAGSLDLAGAASDTEAAQVLMRTYMFMANQSSADTDLLDLIADRVLAHAQREPDLLATFAHQILTSSDIKYRDLERAARAAARAVELTGGSNAVACEAHACALFLDGKTNEAVTYVKTAIELSGIKDDQARLETTLARMQNGSFGRDLSDNAAKARTVSRVYTFLAMSFDEPELLDPLGARVLDLANQDATLLNEFAWSILSTDELKYRSIDTARAAAARAVELTGYASPGLLDTYAKVLFMLDDISGAISNQAQAVELAKSPNERADLEKTLVEYQTAAGQSSDSE